MTSWNNFKTYQGNYANSDEEFMRDATRPRDQYWFKLNNKGWDWHSWIGWADDKEKIQNNYFKAQRYINISWWATSYQDIPFKPWDNQTAKDIGLIKSQYWDVSEIDSDWYIYVKHSWLYQVNVIAQYIKDDERTSASLYTWPCWWYIRRTDEKDNWTNKPHMMVSSSSISFILDLKARDILVVEAWGTVNWTIRFSIVKLW